METELEPSGPVSGGISYEATIVIPRNAFGILRWEIISLDDRGNRINISDQLAIEDIILPEITDIRFWDAIEKDYMNRLTTGDPFKIEVDVKDNIEAARVELSLSYPGMDLTTHSMKRDLRFGDIRTYTHEIIVPISKIGMVTYEVVVFDHDNKTFISDVGTTYIVDNDPPTVWNVSVPDSISVMEIKEIRLQAVDNIRITSVRIEAQNYFGTYEEISSLELVGDDLYTAQFIHYTINLEDLEFRIVVDDGTNLVIQSFSVKVRDDMPPIVIIGGLVEGYGYPDDNFINVNVTVKEFSIWTVEGIVFVHEDTGFSVEEYEINGEVVSFQFFPYKLGQWQIQFTVSDENEDYSISYLNFSIYDNTPPFLEIVEPEDPKKKGETVAFSVGNIVDSSEISDIKWRIVGPNGEEINRSGYSLSFKPWAQGLFHIWVTVTDAEGNSAVKDTWLEVEADEDGGGFKMSTPMIVLLVMIVIVGGLVLWLSIKDRIPEWLKEKE
jgi:hypothetical protein